jgi:hypothetical protein
MMWDNPFLTSPFTLGNFSEATISAFNADLSIGSSESSKKFSSFLQHLPPHPVTMTPPIHPSSEKGGISFDWMMRVPGQHSGHRIQQAKAPILRQQILVLNSSALL